MKSLQKFTELFAEQFDESEDVVFEPTTIFKDIDEWDSMIALSIIAMVDDEFDKTINGDIIKNANTIEELYNKVIE
ncbi:acyl carrier protein [uncultured Dokdonia sp.]|uniref:acyl carrier protein n=1 Tax=uncultured Dokdonia sp. TaxID=575653 RepID=UPI0026301C07|nr:acyl carrier protein [uncultured Dokdonia sp.]